VATTGYTKNFVVKNGLTTGDYITLDAKSGNITGANLSVTGNSNLGDISNVYITGGSTGYIISTDGSGNLSFVSPTSTQNPAPMPIEIFAGNTLLIANNYQGLFGVPLIIDGTLDVEGVLIDVNDLNVIGSNTQVQFNDGNVLGASPNFTFDKSTNKVTTKIIRTTPVAFINLPDASTAGAGSRAFIIDASINTFASIVSGGGSYKVPVYSDGTDWLVG
jgi:hypothetical protein